MSSEKRKTQLKHRHLLLSSSAGYYLHLEASAMLPGRNVRLLSRPLRASRGPQCLHFYYNMYGSGSGHLRVLLSRAEGELVLWQRSGEQSIAWLRGSVEFQCDSQHQARLTAVIGFIPETLSRSDSTAACMFPRVKITTAVFGLNVFWAVRETSCCFCWETT